MSVVNPDPDNVPQPEPVLVFGVVFAVLQALNALGLALGQLYDAFSFYGPPLAAAIGVFLATVQGALTPLVRALVAPMVKVRAVLGREAVRKLNVRGHRRSIRS
jgi:hypothetical protein